MDRINANHANTIIPLHSYSDLGGRAYDLYCRPRVPVSIAHARPWSIEEARATLESFFVSEELGEGFDVLSPLLIIDVTVHQQMIACHGSPPYQEQHEVSSLACGEAGKEITSTGKLTRHQAFELGRNLHEKLPEHVVDTWQILAVNLAQGIRFLEPSRASVELTQRSLLVSLDNITQDGVAAFKEEVMTWLLYEGIRFGLIPPKDRHSENIRTIDPQDTQDWISMAAFNIASECLHDATNRLNQIASLLHRRYGGTVSVIPWRERQAFFVALDDVVREFEDAQAALMGLTHDGTLNQVIVNNPHLSAPAEGISNALRLVRRAWSRAHILQDHPVLAVHSLLPPEHVLALLLPISLPLGLAIVQGMVREIKSFKKNRGSWQVGDRKKQQ